MKKMFLIVSFFYLSINNITNPIQPIAPSYNTTTTVSELKERSKRPAFINHGNTGFSQFRVFNFYKKHIFFDEDTSGKPIYKRILEHAADNPSFGKVILVLYYPKKQYQNQFIIVGTYSNPIARKKLLRRMKTFFGYTKEGAIWFPEQNAIIAGTNSPGIADINDLEIGKKFEEWLQKTNNKTISIQKKL